MSANPEKAALLQDHESDAPGRFFDDDIFDAPDSSKAVLNTVKPRIVLAVVRRPDGLFTSYRVAIDSS
jgi:hypothetical protein